MNISKKLLTLLAIFCVIASAATVCAADVDGGSGYDVVGQADVDSGSGYDAVGQADVDSGNDVVGQADDNSGWAGSQYNESDQGGWAGSQYNQDEQGGWAGSQYNETLENAAGEPANATADAPANVTDGDTVAQNMTANATSSHTMLETGNPILALFAVSAVLGSYAVIKRK